MLSMILISGDVGVFSFRSEVHLLEGLNVRNDLITNQKIKTITIIS